MFKVKVHVSTSDSKVHDWLTCGRDFRNLAWASELICEIPKIMKDARINRLILNNKPPQLKNLGPKTRNHDWNNQLVVW